MKGRYSFDFMGFAWVKLHFIVLLKQHLSSLSCASVCSRAQTVLLSLNTLGLSQSRAYLKCGGCVLIKHEGIFNEGCNKKAHWLNN